MPQEPVAFLQATGICHAESWTGYYLRHMVSIHRQPKVRSWVFPNDLSSHVKPFLPYVDGMEAILDHHTLYPLFIRCVMGDDVERVRRYFISGGKRLGGLFSSKRRVCDVPGWAPYCEECIKEDTAPNGMPFWRRDHHVPGILFCWKHSRPLASLCFVCNGRSWWGRMASSPGSHCGCEPTPLANPTYLTAYELASEIELARAASRLLDPDYLPALRGEAMCSLFYAGALRQGLIKGTSLDKRALHDFSLLLAQSQVARRLGVHRFSQSGLREALKGRGLVCDPVRAIALLSALWGDWSAVERAAKNDRLLRLEGIPLRGEHAPSPSVQRRRQWRLQQRERRLPTLRAEYKRLRASDLSLTRAQIRLDLPGDVLLRAEDMDAIDEELFGSIDELDGSLARHVLERGEILRRLRHPSRITTEVLLEGHPLAPLWRTKYQKLPQTSIALRAGKEDRCQFGVRVRADLGGGSPLSWFEERSDEDL